MLKLNSSLRFALLLLTVCCLLGSCTLRPPAPPDYRLWNFEAEIAWSVGELSLCAVVTIRGATDPEPAKITSLRFTAPPSMKDITLSEESGTPTVACHGMTANAELLAELWSTAELLTATGKITPVTVTEQDGEQALYAELQIEDSEEIYEFYLEPDSGFPKEIRKGEEQLKIRSFTVKS